MRTYQKEDFDAVLELLNNNMEFDSMTANILKEKLFDDPTWNPESTFIAEINSEIVGFMQGVSRDIRGKRYGYIKLMVVAKQHRKQGIAYEMYQKLEHFFKSIKVDEIRIYDSPLNYFMPGIDPRYTAAVCFAERMGFVRNGDTSNLTVDLQNQDWNVDEDIERLKKDNIIVKRAEQQEKEELIEFVKIDWLLWQEEVEMAYRSTPPAIHIARKDEKIVAFSAHNGNNVGTGWFGPMGTSPVVRGKGIGGILLKLCLQDMKDEGQEKSIIPWVGPIPFYAHHANAKVERVFWRYKKEL